MWKVWRKNALVGSCLLYTSGEELLQTLKYRPFLIKPNIHELSELCGAAIRTKDELAACVRSLQKAGVRNVLVSMGRDGACLFTEPGEVLYAAGISGKAGNTVGAGDSMVAGFLEMCIRDRLC